MPMNTTKYLTKGQNEIIRLAVPSILANLTIPLVGMVDTAITGRISDAEGLAGIAIATTLFDLLYWNFGFLRLATGGLTAQAFGAREDVQISLILRKYSSIAFLGALGLLAIQKPFLDFVLPFFNCSPDTEAFARAYFSVRIWAAPATLLLMALKGWFIGMQNTVAPMVSDITVNVVNIVFSIYLSLRTPLGILGVAYGTLIAQYSGLLVSLLFILFRYRNHLRFCNNAKLKYKTGSINFQLIIRSVCFILIYVGYTKFTADHGAVQVATGTILMKLFMLFSYITDGFAYAAEALVGRFIGEGNRNRLKQTIVQLFIDSFALSLIFTVIFSVCGNWPVSLMTTDSEVIAMGNSVLVYLIVMPLISAPAFICDGIFVGAAAARDICICMILSAVAFFAVYFLLFSYEYAVFAAYDVHLLVRSIYLTARCRTLI